MTVEYGGVAFVERMEEGTGLEVVRLEALEGEEEEEEEGPSAEGRKETKNED